MAKFAGDCCNSCSSPWTREENKQFEVYLAKFPDDTPDRWHVIAKLMPSRTPLELKLRYDKLLLDVADIEAGGVELPWPLQEDDVQEHVLVEQDVPTSSAGLADRTVVPWTEEEHRLFLIGLEKYGKGNWQSISQNAVTTKTPTQVASHAHKYFIRQSASKDERKQTSIHDITTARGPLDDQSLQRGSMN